MYFLDYCGDLAPVIRLVKSFVKLIQFGIPIMLILFGMIDLGKAVISSKEDEMKKAQGTLLRRFIYAVAVFLVVTLVMFVMNMVSDSQAKGADTSSWKNCWQKY